jgi:hypothetical protein
MSMDEKSWRIFIDEMPEALKAPVTRIFGIMDVAGRRVADDKIKALVPPYFKAIVSNFSTHLLFGVLARSSIIPIRSFKSHKL